MRIRDIVIFNETHKLHGNIGVIRKIKKDNITVSILIPPDNIIDVQATHGQLINTKKKFPYTIQIKEMEVEK